MRFKPSITTFIGRILTDGSVSTRRGFGEAMLVLVKLSTVGEGVVVFWNK